MQSYPTWCFPYLLWRLRHLAAPSAGSKRTVMTGVDSNQPRDLLNSSRSTHERRKEKLTDLTLSILSISVQSDCLLGSLQIFTGHPNGLLLELRSCLASPRPPGVRPQRSPTCGLQRHVIFLHPHHNDLWFICQLYIDWQFYMIYIDLCFMFFIWRIIQSQHPKTLKSIRGPCSG